VKTPGLFGRMVLVSMLTLPLVACSSSMKMSSKKLCEASGGTYAGKVCSPGTPKNAEAICQAHGGVYLAGEDYCDIPIM
jgi:hypothetical protein